MPWMQGAPSLNTHSTVREYFHDTVRGAINNQKVSALDETVAYIVNLLTFYTRADHLFEHTVDGLAIRPLALTYGEALSASTAQERVAALRRLGDVALFVAGVFADNLQRRPVGVEYYIAMGGSAYASLSGNYPAGGNAHGAIFSELAHKFSVFVEVLEEVCDRCPGNDEDLLASYDRWRKTGSRRCARQLRALGIHLPDTPNVPDTKH
ncbi:MAG: hypothetical protein QF841_03625 [Arenicellales bacterium]|nr:hypothetical protein [Arenicellales bacterium]MDP7563554.1 hypothetical protein [Arenicellales bacterium]